MVLSMTGHNKPRILAVSNQKGGVGKTTTAINLGTALAAIDEKVLVIDLDPQGNASTGLGVNADKRKISAYDVLVGNEKIEDALLPTSVPNLSLISSTLDLLGLENDLAQYENRSFRLRDELLKLFANYGMMTPDKQFTYIIIDCPPSLNLLTVNALSAAQSVLIPLQCEFFALEGLSQIISTIDEVRGSLNPELSIHGVILTMFDSRNKIAREVVDEVRNVLGSKVYSTLIPRNVKVSEAPSHGQPVLLYDHTCTGSKAYIELASELIKRERDIVT